MVPSLKGLRVLVTVSLAKGKKYPSATVLGSGVAQSLPTSNALGEFPFPYRVANL